jgi:hypothetical protein
MRVINNLKAKIFSKIKYNRKAKLWALIYLFLKSKSSNKLGTKSHSRPEEDLHNLIRKYVQYWSTKENKASSNFTSKNILRDKDRLKEANLEKENHTFHRKTLLIIFRILKLCTTLRVSFKKVDPPTKIHLVKRS